MKNNQMKTVMNGAMILSLASFVSKLLSALYKVPLQNWTGDAGFYAYQQIYPLYGLGATLALTTLPLFISRFFSNGSLEAKEREELFKRLFIVLIGFSILIFMFLFFSASFIATSMGDLELTSSIQSVSFFYLLLPVLALYRGYFQSQLNMVPTSVSQLFEQVVRVSLILIVAYTFTQTSMSVYTMSRWAMSAAVVGGIAASLYLIIAKQREGQLLIEKTNYHSYLPSYWTIVRHLLTEGVLISAFGSLLLLFQMIDSFTVFSELRASGVAEGTAQILKGVYDRGQPLVQLGLVTSVGLTSSMVPALSLRYNQNKQAFIHQTQSVLRVTMVLASATTVGLIVLIPSFNFVLFEDTAGLSVLRVFMLAVFFMALLMILNNIAHIMHRRKTALTSLVIGSSVKLLGNLILVQYHGTKGASWATILALLSILGIFIWRIPNTLLRPLFDGKFILKLIVSLTGMAMSVYLVMQGSMSLFIADSRLLILIFVLVAVVVGIVTFVWLILKLRVLTLREWLAIPFGKKILRGGKN